MTNNDDWFACLEAAAEKSGERFWKMPTYPEYEKLIESDYADVRNTTKDGCGAIAAGLFIKKFTEEKPWMHLDIAGTADGGSPVWRLRFPIPTVPLRLCGSSLGSAEKPG